MKKFRGTFKFIYSRFFGLHPILKHSEMNLIFTMVQSCGTVHRIGESNPIFENCSATIKCNKFFFRAVEAMQEAAKLFGGTTDSLTPEFRGINSFGSRVLFGDTKEVSLKALRLLQSMLFIHAVIKLSKSPNFTNPGRA